MTLLKDSSRKTKIKGNLDTLWSELHNVDENYAETYLKWCITKLMMNKSHFEEIILRRKLRNSSLLPEEIKSTTTELRTVSHRNIPKNISKWDIVHVNFGINAGDELSDIDSENKKVNGHYGIVVKQLGFLFLVIPITSQVQRGQTNNLVLKNLGLPGITTESHVAYNKIRTVHIRRIQRIHGIKNGKVTITDPNAINSIKAVLKDICGI